MDPVTKWHNHHASRTGEAGRWLRILTPRQVALIERHLGDWMVMFGYAMDPVI